MLNIDDREVVGQIRGNIYLQYVVGLSSFQTCVPFDASLLVSSHGPEFSVSSYQQPAAQGKAAAS